MRVALGAAGNKCFIARSKGLTGTAGEMHASIARDGRHFVCTKFPVYRYAGAAA